MEDDECVEDDIQIWMRAVTIVSHFVGRRNVKHTLLLKRYDLAR